MTKKPIHDVVFWDQRLELAKESGRLSDAVYRTTDRDWQLINNTHRKIIDNVIGEDSVLDVGCGYGRASEFVKGEYEGIDQTPKFIEIAEERYPNKWFQIADMKLIPRKTSYVDWCLCISIQMMVLKNRGIEEWLIIEQEMLRVSRKGILLLEYGVGDFAIPCDTYTVIYK